MSATLTQPVPLRTRTDVDERAARAAMRDQIARLDKVSEIAPGFPYELLGASVEGQMVYGDLEPLIDLPRTVPYRVARRDAT